MKYPLRKQIGDRGEYLVAGKFIELFGGPCRLQNVDLGVDAEYEFTNAAHNATGELLKIQIKATSKSFKPGVNNFLVEKKHLAYWKNSSVPVIFCYVSLQSHAILWTYIDSEQEYLEVGGKGKHRLTLHASQHLLGTTSEGRLQRIANRSNNAFFQALKAARRTVEEIQGVGVERVYHQNPGHCALVEALASQLRHAETAYEKDVDAQQDPLERNRLDRLWGFCYALTRKLDRQADSENDARDG